MSKLRAENVCDSQATTENNPLKTVLRQFISVLCAKASRTNNEQKVKVACKGSPLESYTTHSHVRTVPEIIANFLCRFFSEYRHAYDGGASRIRGCHLNMLHCL